MAQLLEAAITGSCRQAAEAKVARGENIAFIRNKLTAALSAAGAAVIGMAEALRSDVDRLAARAENWSGDDPEPLGEDVVEPLADALRLVIEAQGLIDPHQRMFSAIERYQQGED